MTERVCIACGVPLVRRPDERIGQWKKRRACCVAHKDYRPDPERFAEKYTVHPETGCWEWSEKRNRGGYGVFTLSLTGGRTVLAHRFSLKLAGVEIPDGMVVDHLCRVRHCVNPEHLDVVTNRENLLRGMGWSGTHYRKTHCVRGHKFDDDNTVVYVTADGREQRNCRECINFRARRRRARLAAVRNGVPLNAHPLEVAS